MPDPVIRCEGAGKTFCRTHSAALRHGTADLIRRLLRQPPKASLRPDEFWALHDVSFTVHPGECLGIIGPNGAGKSTLLKLINGDYRPDRGRVVRDGAITSLIRLGEGLQPMLTGRENIYVKCSELGFRKIEADRLLGSIVAFSGLENSLDEPVRRYSDGMYARLEFAIATCAPMDILLIDEVLAVGDVAFQMRCLRRLQELKRMGTAILFVSHSEMNVRQIADRCLLLFDGEALGQGKPDALFRKYYETTGFVDRALEPLGLTPQMPGDFTGAAHLTRLSTPDQMAGAPVPAQTGAPLRLTLGYQGLNRQTEPVALVLQFWSATGLLIGAFDSSLSDTHCRIDTAGEFHLELPFLGLAAGIYRIAGGFRAGGRWLGYRSDLGRLRVTQSAPAEYRGLLALNGRLLGEDGYPSA